MSSTRIIFSYVRRFAAIVTGCGQRFVYRYDAPVCPVQPGRRRF
jgi:hypothetical protein